MVNWRSLSRFVAGKAATSAATNSYKVHSNRALRIEAFEDRKMFDIGAAGPDLIAIIPNEGDVIQNSQVLHVAPRELLFRFEDGSVINPATLGGIEIVRSGGDGVFGNGDATVPIGFVGIGEHPNEVIVRFAETLPDDLYQITVRGSGLTALRGSVPPTGTNLPFNGGVDLVRTFDLDLGAQVVSVVPQPVVRGTDNKLTQQRDTVHVYFNNDDLNLAAAQNINFYELIRTNDTDTNLDDVIIRPISAAYSANPNATLGDPGDRVVLKFNPSDLVPGTYRLRIGNNDPLPLAPVHIAVPADDLTPAASTFNTAQSLGALGAVQGLQSVIVSSSIDPQDYTLAWPGGNDEPGHRDIFKESHQAARLIGLPILDVADRLGGTAVFSYNFQDVYGADPFGNILHNVITEAQKQRAREIFGLFSQYAGVQFVETAFSGFTIATGDLRAVDPLVITGPGGVGGIAGGSVAVMDNAEDWGNNEFGGGWFQTAMHEIGHLLGLGHTYDLPPLTIQGSEGEVTGNTSAEPSFPGDHDITHIKHLYRPDVKDIDVYKIDLAQRGTLSIETIAERLSDIGQDSSLLDSVITIYNQNKQIIARNDDYFSQDSFVELQLEAGSYYVAVTSKGNTNFDLNVEDSGMGGLTQGEYQLRMNFTPAPSQVNGIRDATSTLLDGDADGRPGGVFDFWFRTQQDQGPVVHNIFVDKAANPAQGIGFPLGSINNPYLEIDQALADAEPGDIVRIVGNNSVPQAGQIDNRISYNIGTDILGNALVDGRTMEIPQRVTVMVDSGALIKLRNANITAGSVSQGADRSQGALQILGTPVKDALGADIGRVIFTSFDDDSIGRNPDLLTTTANSGDWGGLVFTADSDREADGIFLSSVNHADIRFGGGQVVVNSVQQIYNPIHMITARPTISHNLISRSADAGISADPNSFEDSEFQNSNFTADYRRSGPDIHGNRLDLNTMNGLFVRIDTESGQSVDRLTVPARFDDTDIVHIVAENLIIQGTAGGPELDPVDENDPNSAMIIRARLDARLAIDPGIVVKASGARIEASLSGQLIAEGTKENRVIFTSLSDDKFGAGGTFDTTSDLAGTLPLPGNWGGIYIGHMSTGSVDHALITYGGGSTTIEGGFARFNAVEVHQADFRLANSTIEFNDDGAGSGDRNGRIFNSPAAIFIRGSQPALLDNVIRHNNGPAISANVNALSQRLMNDPGRTTGQPATTGSSAAPIDLHGDFYSNVGPLVHGNRLEDNDINGMVVRGGIINVQSIWDDTDIVHVVQNEIVSPDLHTFTGLRLQSSNTERLVVKLLGPNAGFTAFGRPLDIDDRIGGTVQIIGTPGHPVVLTSIHDDTVGAGFDASGKEQVDTDNNGASTPAPGDWRSVLLDSMSNDRNVQVINETEGGFTSSGDTNDSAPKAQFIGILAPNEKSGDDNLRLGFEVHGALSQAFNASLSLPQRNADVDVYSFQAKGGTEVWIDIDNTTSSLDTVLEVVDALGSVVARSNNSEAERASEGLLFGQARSMKRGIFSTPDLYTTNVKDAGLRVLLPGSTTQNNTYYIRVRANSPDLNNLTAGQTHGAYQLQVRLRELDEVPGSIVRYANIRYATNGIEVLGKPEHSPILGESGEENVTNDTFGAAQDLGDLLTADRNTLGVGGRLTTATDIDWFKFTLDYDLVQQIGPNDINTWATVFDIDYADGISRADTTLSVFDQDGNLIFIGRDSDVGEDQPGPTQGSDFTDLNRGSFGKFDPYIGSVHLNEGTRLVTGGGTAREVRTYFVAVSSTRQLPNVLNATFQANASNSLVRMEPIDSIRTIAEDRIGFQGGGNFDSAAAKPLFDPFGNPLLGTIAQLNSYADDFHLGDITTFVITGEGSGRNRDLLTIDPFTGALETDLTGNGRLPGTHPVNLFYNDLVMRNDGRLFTLSDRIRIGNPNIDAQTGNLRELSPQDGATTTAGDDNIVTYQLDPTGNPVVQGTGIHYEGMAYNNAGPDDRRLWAIGWRGQGLGVDETINLLYELDPNTGAALRYVFPPAVATPTFLTDAVPDNGPGNFLTAPTIFTYAATDIVSPLNSPGDLTDGLTFSISIPVTPPTFPPTFTTTTFEIDTGPDVRFVLDGNGRHQFRDGQSFTLNGIPFEFNSGRVLVVTGGAASFIDGDNFVIYDNNNTPNQFEFDTNNTVSPGSVPITIVPADSIDSISQKIVSAINNAPFNASAARNPGSNRISLTNVTDASPFSETSNGLQFEGNAGVTAGSFAIQFEETFTNAEIGDAIATTVDLNANPIDAGYARDRVTFLEANTFDFTNTPAFQYFPGSTNGVTNNNVRVAIGADDAVNDVSIAVAAAINSVPVPTITATAVGGRQVQLVGNPNVQFDPGTTQFSISGSGAGGQITGIDFVGNTMYAVSDGGGVFRINGLGGRGTATITPITAITQPGSNLPARFSGLSAGPVNVENGRYARTLFATTYDGDIYALSVDPLTLGQLDPVFVDGRSVINTGIQDIRGIAFTPIDYNLWHVSGRRDNEVGHGVNISPDRARTARELGGNSFYFGIEDPNANPVSPQPGAGNFGSNAGVYNTYDMPGGSYGALSTDTFSLKEYAPSDKPTVYFNYFLDTESQDSTRTNHTLMRDAFRVMISEDGVNWDTLATNNSLLSRFADDTTELPYYISDSGGLYRNERIDPDFFFIDPFVDPFYPPQPIKPIGDQHAQELFDSTGAWRQARVDLGDWAGKANLRLRFEFNTSGTFSIGDIETTGQLLSAIAGNQLDDGDSFSFGNPLGPVALNTVFEFDMGLSLRVPPMAGFAIQDGETVTITAPGNVVATFEFDKNGVVQGSNIALPITSAMTPAEVVAVLQQAITTELPGIAMFVSGTRIQLSNAIAVQNNSALTVEGDPAGTQTIPGSTLVPINTDMTDAEVAVAMATAIDARFCADLGTADDPNTFTSVKVDKAVLHVIGKRIVHADKLGIALSSRTNEFGDFQGDFNNRRQRGQENRFEGVFVDDIVIGFAERGEMVTGNTAASDTAFFARPVPIDPPGTSVLNGPYQLEIRRGTEYAEMFPPGLVLEQSFDTNDRMVQGISLLAPTAAEILEGQTFEINDGLTKIIFEFDSDNVVQPVIPPAPPHVPIRITSDLTAEQIAGLMATAINSVDRPNRPFKVRAVVLPGSNRVDLSGAMSTDAPEVPLNPTPPGFFEPDTILNAGASGLTSGSPGTYAVSGQIGNRPDFDDPSRDVDMISFQANTGDTMIVDVDESLFNPLDSILRIFDRLGSEVARSDNDAAPGELLGVDPYLEFIVPATGIYYVALSGAPNDQYDPFTENSGLTTGNDTGFYSISLTLNAQGGSVKSMRFDGNGDKNLHRDQGYTILQGNQITNSANFGIRVDADPRTVGNSLPHAGVPRNLMRANDEQARLVPGLTIANNLLVGNQAGGIQLSGDDIASPGAAALFSRIINNSIFGAVGTRIGVGIQVNETASPTVMNNIIANTETGLEVAGNSNTTIAGYNLYQGNGIDRTGIGETGATVLGSAAPLFISPGTGNFYLAPGSAAIDSSRNSLPEREDLRSVTAPLGIPESPILAPELDLFGQLRVDDPTVASPPGLGSNVFKDRGALDRADFVGPSATLLNPPDNDAAGKDKDSRQHFVQIAGRPANFQVQFLDQGGAGIDDLTAAQNRFILKKDGVELLPTVDFLFSYDKTNDVARFDAAAGVFLEGNYTIEVANTGGQAIKDVAGNVLRPNEATGKTIFTVAVTQAVAAGSWQNPNNPLDVNNDGAAVGLDALIVINALNNLGSGSPILPTPAPTPPPFYYDVNGDGSLTALDALIIINYLNSLSPQALVASAMTGSADDGVDNLAFSLSVSGAPRGTLVADSSVKPQAVEYAAAVEKSNTSTDVLAAEALDEAVASDVWNDDVWSVDSDKLDDALSDIADELHEAIAAGSNQIWG